MNFLQRNQGQSMARHSTVRVFVPGDTTARSMGADTVAEEIARLAAKPKGSVEVIRNLSLIHI